MGQMMALKACCSVPVAIIHPLLAHITQAKALVTKKGYYFVITTDIPRNRVAGQFEGIWKWLLNRSCFCGPGGELHYPAARKRYPIGWEAFWAPEVNGW
jgi:hypothetical protein